MQGVELASLEGEFVGLTQFELGGLQLLVQLEEFLLLLLDCVSEDVLVDFLGNFFLAEELVVNEEGELGHQGRAVLLQTVLVEERVWGRRYLSESFEEKLVVVWASRFIVRIILHYKLGFSEPFLWI